MQVFPYGEREKQHLRTADSELGCVIDQVGHIQRYLMPDPFAAVVSSVISQQITGRAAQTIWERLQSHAGPISPEALKGLDLEELRRCGLSRPKASYIQGIAEAALAGTLDFSGLHRYGDEEVIAQLTQLRGVGRWTAEMVLIFSLARPDVLSYDDLGIRKGLMTLHQLLKLGREQFEHYRNLYSPYGTTAALYLWHLAGQ